MLTEQIATKVARGEITEAEVLSAIHDIRTNNNFPVILFNRMEPLQEEEDPLNLLFAKNTLSPYKILVRMDMWESLSVDAKEIIHFVITLPFYSPIYNGFNKISKCKLKKELRVKYRWTHRKIKKVFQEIRNFCSELEKI